MASKHRRNEIKAWFHEYKKTIACKECGENHPACIDFHHRDPLQKCFEINRAVHNKMSIAKIQQEIDKCDILCSNCHRKGHWPNIDYSERVKNHGVKIDQVPEA